MSWGPCLDLFLILTVHHPTRLFSECPSVSSESPRLKDLAIETRPIERGHSTFIRVKMFLRVRRRHGVRAHCSANHQSIFLPPSPQCKRWDLWKKYLARRTDNGHFLHQAELIELSSG
ncbi:hypothetical protein BDV27DRAFT_3160 [Aspergillus caelatus]|uniref:Secreted protein n=1 Tax=Aspergillus caelatus TaxID=61420 RepID=A0A5N7A1W0_9EURO|nr:uncharacterized protein BDV27DRAFT_3160 [Aspergillus caelatus]KAE8363854.1 hypothetical protein BDV27DRAFT_3160 [Aspergillus caelatus]